MNKTIFHFIIVLKILFLQNLNTENVKTVSNKVKNLTSNPTVLSTTETILTTSILEAMVDKSKVVEAQVSL